KGNRYEITKEFQKYYTNIQSIKGPTLREIGTRDELYINNGIGNSWKGFEKVTNLKNHFLDENGKPSGVGQGWGLRRGLKILMEMAFRIFMCAMIIGRWISSGSIRERAYLKRSIR